jgi:N-acetyl-alpha-D-muramate 1-phosphate uridylyltransferase
MADSVAGTAPQEHAAVNDMSKERSRVLVGVALAAGEGRRLRPLTDRRPKPLCPVGNVALLDLALGRLSAVTDALAVNLHHGRVAMEDHLDRWTDRHPGGPTVHRSIEEPQALGTAGALGHLRGWIDGRSALVVNADSWTDADLAAFVADWDGERIRLLVTSDPSDPSGQVRFGPRMGLVASLLPWADVADLRAEPSGLYEVMWVDAHGAGRLETIGHHGRFVDCGTPADYLRANLEAVADAGGSIVDPDAAVADGAEVVDSVIATGAVVAGTVQRCVLWPGAEVAAGEVLVGAVRAPGLTVSVEG